MAATRKSGTNSHPNAVNNSWLARKPPRRRAPLHANTPPSSSNRAALIKQGENELSQSVSGTTSVGRKINNRPNRQYLLSKKRVKTKPPVKTNPTANAAKITNEIPVMPTAQILPTWLNRIHQLQKISSILTFALVSATLAVYALNVYSQQSWGMAYKKLQRLQKIEQQLTTKNEVLKNKIAGEAEKASTGLVSPTPGEAIFISPASSPPSTANQVQKPLPQTDTMNTNQTPMGY